MSEHRNLIAKTLLDPRYANTGLTLVGLFDKVKDSGLFPTKEHLSKVLSKMHGSNLVKRSIATQTYGSRWSITLKGRDLYRGAFDHAEQKLEMVGAELQTLNVKVAINEIKQSVENMDLTDDAVNTIAGHLIDEQIKDAQAPTPSSVDEFLNQNHNDEVINDADAEIEAAADALPKSVVSTVSKHLDDAVQKCFKKTEGEFQCMDEFLSPNSDDDDDDEFGAALFHLGYLHTKALEQAKKAKKSCPITNIHQKIEDLSNLNHAIKALVKMNVVVLDELIAELTELL